MRKTQGKLEKRNRNYEKNNRKHKEILRKREWKPLERTFKTQGKHQKKGMETIRKTIGNIRSTREEQYKPQGNQY